MMERPKKRIYNRNQPRIKRVEKDERGTKCSGKGKKKQETRNKNRQTAGNKYSTD